MIKVIGIDPGKKGGIAYRCGKKAVAWKMPPTPEAVNDHFSFIFSTYGKPDVVYLERLSAHPDHGTIAGFKLGESSGILKGIVVARRIPMVLVVPAVWMRYLDCLTKGDKNITKAKAIELFPRLKITHDTADSLLIAEYGVQKES